LAISFDNIVADNLVNLIQKTQKSLIKELPKNVEIFDEESDNLIGTDKQFNSLTTVNLAVVRLMDFIVQDEFAGKMQKIISSMAEQIMTVNIELQDHLRLLVYNIENREINVDEFKDYLASEIKALEENYSKYDELANGILLQIEERQRIINEKVSIYPFVQAAMNLKQYIKSRDIEKRNLWLSNSFKEANSWLRNFAADLWYRQSSGMIFTQDILLDKANSFSLNKKQRIAISNLKSPNGIVDDLPFYYKQLFTNRNNYMPEFWVERKSEEKELEHFISDWNANSAQAMLISGTPGSGKSFLSYRIVNYISASDKIYTVLPPKNGSISINVFKHSLKEALDANSIDSLFTDIKEKSLIIFEDVELWWSKSNDGFEVIDEIHRIIRQYANKFLFVVIINSFTFNFISKLRSLTEIYTHSVFLASVDARMLERMIWKRHILGGLKLKLDNKEQSNFHAWDFSRLFSKYFRQSKGYPYTAMDAWVNNVIEINDKEILIRNPIILDISVFDSFLDLDLWVLQLFILHKNMNYSKLAKLTELDSEVVVRKINELMRVGIIEEIKENIYCVSSLVRPYIINVLKSKKYL
jgi:DNA replication protein DnaC